MTVRHREIEVRFRAIVEAAGLLPFDEVAYEERAVLFLWHGIKLCVAVDFDDGPVDDLPLLDLDAFEEELLRYGPVSETG
jgi:hypothetical protein